MPTLREKLRAWRAEHPEYVNKHPKWKPPAKKKTSAMKSDSLRLGELWMKDHTGRP